MTLSNGFPEMTDSYLAGQDILYGQFNDVNFYIEDADQEVLYFNVLVNLFPDIKLEKIFPLNGKTNVVQNCQANIGNRKKVYIVDDDFDDILGKKFNLQNLFYIQGYSIENFLLSKKGMFELIRFYNPKLKDSDIENLIDYTALLRTTTEGLKALALSFIVIQKYSLGLPYYKINTNRDFNFSMHKPYHRHNFIPDYLRDVERVLQGRDGRFTLKAKMRPFKPFFSSLQKSSVNIPGKYLLEVVKDRLIRLGLIKSINLSSFMYFLSKDYDGQNLEHLKLEVENFIT